MKSGPEANASEPEVVQHSAVPVELRALSSIADADYADVFSIQANTGSSPEQWAVSMFEDAVGFKAQIVWRGLLGLRLRRKGTPGCVAGWKIGGVGDTWIRLEAASWLITANLVVQVEGGRTTAATFIDYKNSLAAAYWPRLASKHREFMPFLLRFARRVHQR